VALNIAPLPSKQSAFEFPLGTLLHLVAPSGTALRQDVSAANAVCKSTDISSKLSSSVKSLSSFIFLFLLLLFSVCFALCCLIAIVVCIRADCAIGNWLLSSERK
jgi:hypothetical protein